MGNRDFVEFLGWEGSYARFKIKSGQLSKCRNLERIIVVHEGDRTNTDEMLCHREVYMGGGQSRNVKSCCYWCHGTGTINKIVKD